MKVTIGPTGRRRFFFNSRMRRRNASRAFSYCAMSRISESRTLFISLSLVEKGKGEYGIDGNNGTDGKFFFQDRFRLFLSFRLFRHLSSSIPHAFAKTSIG